MKRGQVWWAVQPLPIGRRPVVLISRNQAYNLRQSITVALVTTRARGIDSEIPLGQEEGLPKPCVVSADNLTTIPKRDLSHQMGELSSSKIQALNEALLYALELPR